MSHLLTLMTFVPLIGALALLLLPSAAKSAIRWLSVVATFIPVLLSGVLFLNFNRAEAGMQFVEKLSWIETYNIHYYMGVDGISVTMILLTALLSFLCIFASWNIEKSPKGYFFLFLLLETGMIGTFCALDLFLFYIFWELMLLPMYFLIGIWGGPRKEYAAIKFFLYTLVGSVFMLLGFLAVYFYGGEPHTFDMLELAQRHSAFSVANLSILGLPFAKVVFVALFFGFAIKVPMFPFHTWLPDAHVEAPTAISVILAGILLKMGTYGVFRICYPILPEASVWFAPFLAVMGAINIIYGAFCAMHQTDIKKLVAYSSVSHMGYCLLGMAALTKIGMNGALLQMFNHGTATAMLFLLVGVIYDRAHTRGVNDFGGLAHNMPVFTTIASIAFFASMGLPGLSSFISEALVLIGSFNADALFSERFGYQMLMFTGDNLFKICTVIGALGVIITASYLLWTVQRVFLGPLNEKWKDLKDLNVRELFTLVPLAALVVFLGIYPMPILNMIGSSLEQLSGLMASPW
ncbi:MAG TPA: NADH-quinone oxidoreductase subunit M [Bdellovibrionota bacterium]|nr:NADH-quinone oxidoreductase subunit M [Bdellovibrionota bacterium]